MPRNDDVFSGYLDSLFTDIDFERRTVLDVGGGNGVFSRYGCRSGGIAGTGIRRKPR
jgi:hypothetical protein